MEERRARIPDGYRHVLVTFVLIFSGFASLVYQVVWQRVLTQEIGLDASSMAIIVSIFMLGLGFGSLTGGLLTKYLRRHLNLLYASIEILIGLFGLISIPLLREVNAAVSGAGAVSLTTTFLVNAAVLVPPILLMGMTIPVILQILLRQLDQLGRIVGVFYGVNIVGAALGAVLSGFILIEWLGLTGTVTMAGVVNIAIGAIFFACSFFVFPPLSSRETEEPASGSSQQPGSRYFYYAAAAMFGASTLAFEVILFRVCSYALRSEVYVFPLMLAVYLAMMGVGNAISGIVIDRVAASRLRGYTIILLSLTLALTVVAFRGVEAWMGRAGHATSAWSISNGLAVIAMGMLPILPLSAFFPLIVKLTTKTVAKGGQNVGVMLFWYTVGNFLGCVLPAFFLLPSLGTILTTRLVLMLTLGGVVLTWIGLRSIRRVAWKPLLAAAGVIVLGGYLLPADFYARTSEGIDIAEDDVGVVEYLPGDKFEGGVSIGGLAGARVFKDIQHLVPREFNFSQLMILDPEFRPRKVLVIGIGPAAHVWGLTAQEDLEEIVIVELSSRTVEFVYEYSAPEIIDSLNHPKVKIVTMDGRRYLQQALANNKEFDLIQLGTFYPDQAGSANLYSIDLIEKARSCLSEHGYFVTLDCYGSAGSALRVFKTGFILEGMPLYSFFTDREEFPAGTRIISGALARGYTAPSISGRVSPVARTNPSTFGVVFLNRDQLQTPVNSDNYPRYEYSLLHRRANRLLSDPLINLRTRIFDVYQLHRLEQIKVMIE